MIETSRLRLRPWRDADRAAFAAMNRDAEVMQDLGGPLGGDESDAKFERYAAAIRANGFGRWLIEDLAGDFLGYAGVLPSRPDHPLGPHHEIGWRLVRSAWGRGVATEASRAALDDAFARGLEEVLAYTGPDNHRSQRVMARLGLTRDPGRDFTTRTAKGGAWAGLTWYASPRPPS